MRQRQDYIPLSTGSESANSDEVDPLDMSDRRDTRDRFMLIATIGVVCTTLLSATILILAPNSSSPNKSIAPHSQPNPYIHLDKLLANATLDFQAIVNFPQITFQYHNADIQRHMREDGRDYVTSFGMIYPDDRRIVADNELSTVLQFRNLDYAMEHCVLHIVVPRASGEFNPDVRLSDPSNVDIWLLDGRVELSRYVTGSTDYAPPRQTLLTTLSVSEATSSVSESFFCRTGEYTTVELTCALGFLGCTVDFWQDERAKPRGGVFLMQYPTRKDVAKDY